MSHEEVLAFLDESRTISIGTIGKDGHPHLVAMWFVITEGHVEFWTYKKSVKALNLRRDQRLTVMAESGDTYETLRAAVLYGRARIFESADEIERVGMAMLGRYSPPVDQDAALHMVRKQVAGRIAVRVQVDRIVSWDHRKIDRTSDTYFKPQPAAKEEA